MYDLILFDIDGVLLSEERYFDASALTVYELLCGPEYLGLSVSTSPITADWMSQGHNTPLRDETISLIRKFVFADDRILDFMKARGVNANWDMVYLQFGYQLAHTLAGAGIRLEAPQLTREHLVDLGAEVRNRQGYVEWQDFALRYESCQDKHDLFRALKQDLHELCGVPLENVDELADSLWNIGQQAFQDWYLGEPYRDTQTAKGKSGFLDNEVPLADVEELTRVLQALRDNGAHLGVATGRPEVETYVPLRQLGWLDRFDADRITTASDVLRAQETMVDAPPLSKPHPFSYLRSYLRSPDAATVLQHPLPLPQGIASKVLVVGDSVADWMAAKAIGCEFAAVLTGLSGEAAREKFESLGCTYIWDGVLDVRTLL